MDVGGRRPDATRPDVKAAETAAEDDNDNEEEIEEDFDVAYKGILMLPKDARLGVLIAYVYYRRLFSKIRSIPSHRIMEERIRIPNSSKYALLMSCYIKNNLNLI